MCVFVELENTLPENILQYEMLESMYYWNGHTEISDPGKNP